MNNPYALVHEDTASSDLERLDKAIAVRIKKRLEWLATNAADIQHEALTGQWSGLYRLRTGDYRIIYDLRHDEQLIMVEHIGHRRDVYDE